MGKSQKRNVNQKDIPNKVRGFMIYSILYDILEDYIEWGDGLHALAVFDEDVYDESSLIDTSIINIIKLLSTGYGLSHINEAIAIVRAIHESDVGKRAVRFRSRHPLFANGTPLYQNVCLVSGMIHMNIPILPYYDGEKLLVDLIEDIHIDIEGMKVNDRSKQ